MLVLIGAAVWKIYDFLVAAGKWSGNQKASSISQIVILGLAAYYASGRHFAKHHVTILRWMWPAMIIAKHINDIAFQYNGINMNSILPIFYAIATRVPFRSVQISSTLIIYILHIFKI